jgi:hypothetical protein
MNLACRAAFAAWPALLLLLLAQRAAAFCQATSCDPGSALCKVDSQGCLVEGLPLFWPGSCVTVSVQADGAPKQHIDYAAAQASASRAFAAWTSAPCAGGPPSITVEVNGPISCAASEYNSDRGNANILVFREDVWPYVGGEDALGLTRIRFDPSTGEIWDSDIEVNAVTEPLTVGDPSPHSVDLDSLLTHEAGHLLGLGHTRDETATMFPGYVPGSIELRSLAADDVAGICEIYPPSRQAGSASCEPRHGYADLCGADQPVPAPSDASPSTSTSCGLSSAPRGRHGTWALLLTALLLLSVSRRRRPVTR